ncbi:Bromodomain-containing protein [Obelidium mucronatum]|nr:Bromodomain-containing protein [Obelidium mucronatum]
MKRSIDEGTEDEEFGADFAGADEGVFGLEPPLGYGSSSADESGAKRQRLDDAANNSPPPPAFDRKVDVAAASAVETPPVSSVGEAPRADDVEDEDDLDADDHQHQQHDQQPADPVIDAESKPEPAAEALPPTAAAPAPVPAPVPAPEPIYYSTPLDKFQLKFCNRILGRAKRLKDAFMFLQPVDPIKLNIPTYFHFIKRPMDLSTIQKKLDGQVYKTAHGFIDDVTLMFDNCYTFNGRDSAVGLIAQNFQRYFTQQLEKMPNQIEPEKKRAPPSSAASHLYHAPPAPIERPKRDVQPLIRDNLSPARKPLSKQAVSDLKYAANVVRELMKPRYQKINHPFLVPVDPVALGIPTYPLIIKHPMDFGTILRRLDAGFYSSGAEFESDSRLVFKNCYTFNAPGSEVFEMGRALEQIFDLKWREKPFVAPSTRKPSLGMVGGDSDDSSSEEEQEDLNKMQENLLKLMQEVTKLAAHKGSKKKEKHKKHKMHALLQQQALVASMAGAAAASSGSTVSAPKKKKKSSHSSRPKTSAAPVREITYQQKKELSEKIEDLSPDQLEGVYQIIRSGMPSLDTQAAGQDEIELDIDSLDKVTLSRLYHFVVNAARPTSAPPAQPKSLSHTCRRCQWLIIRQ